jgi:hypothetical protein
MTTINKEIKLLPFIIPTDIRCFYAGREDEFFVLKLKSLTEDEAKAYAMMVHNEILKQWDKEKSVPSYTTRSPADIFKNISNPFHTSLVKTDGIEKLSESDSNIDHPIKP